MTKEEFEELDKRYGGLKEDPDNLGVVPTTEQPEWYLKLFDEQDLINSGAKLPEE